jgi:hypothetical protein
MRAEVSRFSERSKQAEAGTEGRECPPSVFIFRMAIFMQVGSRRDRKTGDETSDGCRQQTVIASQASWSISKIGLNLTDFSSG